MPSFRPESPAVSRHDPADAAEVHVEPAPAVEERSLGWLGWLISGSVHALVLLLFVVLVFGSKLLEEPVAPVRNVQATPPPIPPTPIDRSFTDEKPVPIVIETTEPNPIPQVDLPVEQPQTDDDHPSETAKGNPDALSTSELQSTAAFMSIGAGGGAASAWGNGPGGRRKKVGKLGGTPGSESAVEAALRWLKRHQSANGMWDAVGYAANCSEHPRCEPGILQSGDTNAALTGYALLCYLGAGYDHKSPNKFRDTVRRGIDYLVSVQTADGRVGKRNYEQGVCAMALAEAYAMTADAELKDPAQRAMHVIVEAQNNDPKATDPVYQKLGWDYLKPGDRSDLSVTGWNVMALKSGLAAGLDVGNALHASKHMLKTIWEAANPQHAQLDPYGESRFPYTYHGSTGKVDIAGKPGAAAKDLACVGLVCAVFLGYAPGDRMLDTLANYAAKYQTPSSWADLHTYYTYYNTLAMFQVQGPHWQKWNSVVRDLLVSNQRRNDGCFDGSWNFADTRAWHGIETGRVLSTVYCCLSLEVYYRHDLVTGGKAKKP